MTFAAEVTIHRTQIIHLFIMILLIIAVLIFIALIALFFLSTPNKLLLLCSCVALLVITNFLN